MTAISPAETHVGNAPPRVLIVDDTSESHKVTKVFGPYPSR